MKLMKKLLSAVTAAALGLTMTTALSTGTVTSTASAADMTAVELVEDMGLGWNLGNALDSTNTWTANLEPSDIETAWGNVETTEAMIQEIKKAGFNTVRIPVTWWDMTGTTGTASMSDFDGEVAEKFLARVKEVVDYCIDNDMYAIINTHHDEDWEKDTSKIDIFEKLWKQIATYFADYDEHLVFEGMNEVSFSSNAEAMTYNQAFVDTVRATGDNNSDRLLIVTAVSNNTSKALSSDFSMPDDDSDMLAVSVHYYEPSTFCVASTDSIWGYSSTWGTTSEYTTLANDFEDLKEKFTDNGYGVIIGEYGVCNADKYYTTTSYDKDQDSIEAYYKEVMSRAYEIEGVCAIAWDDSDSGTIALFSRKTRSWYATEIYDILQEVLNGETSDVYEKTDRVSFDADEIDEGDGSWLIDLSEYADLGVTVSSVVVNYTMTSELGSSEYTGDINLSFNIIEDGNDATDPTWCYLDSGGLAVGDTVYTFDFPSDNTYVTETDDNGNAVTTLNGELDMDYLKLESWWTWSGTDDDTVTITIESVTVIFDGYIYTESGDGTTTTTTETTATDDTDDTTSGDPVGNAYLIGSFGTAENWAADGDSITSASVTGDGTYTVSWDLEEATSTGSSWFLAVQIDPAGEADTFTTDTFEDLEVTLDSVTVDGVAIEDLSTAYINTRYYESNGVTRIYLHDDWTKTGAEVLDDMDIESNITVTFTISGTGIEASSDTTTTTTETTTTTTETTTTSDGGDTTSGDPVGNAYLIGSFGTAENWAADGDSITSASVTGDGTYTVSWDLEEATSTGSSWFLAVQIDPAGEADTFTTDTFEDLEVTLDSVTVDGVAIEDLSTAYINTRYYESNGVTRIYLHDDWTKTGAEVLDDMDIESNITVTFTISGTGIEASSDTTTTTTTTTTTETTDTDETTTTTTTTNTDDTTTTTTTTTTDTDATTTTEETTTTTSTTTTTETTTITTTVTVNPEASLCGDINLDGNVTLADAVLLTKAGVGFVTLNSEATANGDCNGDGYTDSNDVSVLLRFMVQLVNTLPYTS
ncbi:MAG: cellulase family glycosylhydrolase [Ruminococcus sp.]|nr:cellulase family glycosylhydrolase [Ruminococcus sp.]